MADKMIFEILEDGTVKVNTDKISDKNHANADDVLELLEDILGSTRKTEQKEGHTHTHHHHHGKKHQHS